jgi:hypothetical protein
MVRVHLGPDAPTQLNYGQAPKFPSGWVLSTPSWRLFVGFLRNDLHLLCDEAVFPKDVAPATRQRALSRYSELGYGIACYRLQSGFRRRNRHCLDAYYGSPFSIDANWYRPTICARQRKPGRLSTRRVINALTSNDLVTWYLPVTPRRFPRP